MSYTIRPVTPFSATERRRLRRWLDRLTARCADAADRVSFHRGAITIKASDDVAHNLAQVAMIVLGRPFHYSLIGDAQADRAAA